jgi:hypothetical protein
LPPTGRSLARRGHNSLAAANSTGILALGWAMPDPDTSGQTRIDLWLDVNRPTAAAG